MTDHAAPPPPPSVPPATPPPPPGVPPAVSPPPPNMGGTGGGGKSNPLMLVLSYLGIFALIPYLVEKEDREVQWHAKHGLVLFGAWVVLWFALWMVGAMFGDFLGCILALISLPLSLGILVLHIVMIVKALNGQRFRLPGISEFADKF